MEVVIHTPQGKFTSRIENTTSFKLSKRVSLVSANYVNGKRSPLLVRKGNELELVKIHKNKRRADIHARICLASYAGREGVVVP